jgi:hypothetical protein
MNRLREILESKTAYRRRLADKPVAEKLRIVEALAERTLAIRAGRMTGNQMANKPVFTREFRLPDTPAFGVGGEPPLSKHRIAPP